MVIIGVFKGFRLFSRNENVTIENFIFRDNFTYLFASLFYYSEFVHKTNIFWRAISICWGVLKFFVYQPKVYLELNNGIDGNYLAVNEANNITDMINAHSLYENWNPYAQIIINKVEFHSQSTIVLIPKLPIARYVLVCFHVLAKCRSFIQFSEVLSYLYLARFNWQWVKTYICKNELSVITSDPASPLVRILLLISASNSIRKNIALIVSRQWDNPVEWNNLGESTEIFVHNWFADGVSSGNSYQVIGQKNTIKNLNSTTEYPIVFFTQWYASGLHASYIQFWCFTLSVARWVTKNNGIVQLHPKHTILERMILRFFGIVFLRISNYDFETICKMSRHCLSHSSGANYLFKNFTGRPGKFLRRLL